jgi:hypothetical protein
MHAEAPAGVKGAAANEGLADHVASDPDAVSVADEDRVDVRIVDPVALDRDIAILETVWKAVDSFGERDPDGDGAQGVAAPGHLVGAGDALGEMVVPEREIVGEHGFGPEADVAARLERYSIGLGELAGFDDGVRRLDEHPAAGVEATAPNRRAGADPGERCDAVSGVQWQVVLQHDVVDEVRLGGRALVLPKRGDFAFQFGRLSLRQLRDPGPAQRPERSVLAGFDHVAAHQALVPFGLRR